MRRPKLKHSASWMILVQRAIPVLLLVLSWAIYGVVMNRIPGLEKPDDARPILAAFLVMLTLDFMALLCTLVMIRCEQRVDLLVLFLTLILPSMAFHLLGVLAGGLSAQAPEESFRV